MPNAYGNITNEANTEIEIEPLTAEIKRRKWSKVI